MCVCLHVLLSRFGPGFCVSCGLCQTLRRCRSKILYTLTPYDRSFWNCVRDPWHVGLLLCSCCSIRLYCGSSKSPVIRRLLSCASVLLLQVARSDFHRRHSARRCPVVAVSVSDPGHQRRTPSCRIHHVCACDKTNRERQREAHRDLHSQRQTASGRYHVSLGCGCALSHRSFQTARFISQGCWGNLRGTASLLFCVWFHDGADSCINGACGKKQKRHWT